MSKRIVIAPDINGDDQIQFWEDSILQGTLRMFDLRFVFSRPIDDGGSHSTHNILNNASAIVHIGDKRYDRAFFIDYVVERDTLYEAGELTVIYKEGTDFSISRVPVAGDISGISFGFSTDGNNIVLTATLTDATYGGTLKITTKTIAR